MRLFFPSACVLPSPSRDEGLIYKEQHLFNRFISWLAGLSEP